MSEWTCERDPSTGDIACSRGLPKVMNRPPLTVRSRDGEDSSDAAKREARAFFATREGLNFTEVGVVVS